MIDTLFTWMEAHVLSFVGWGLAVVVVLFVLQAWFDPGDPGDDVSIEDST